MALARRLLNRDSGQGLPEAPPIPEEQKPHPLRLTTALNGRFEDWETKDAPSLQAGPQELRLRRRPAWHCDKSHSTEREVLASPQPPKTHWRHSPRWGTGSSSSAAIPKRTRPASSFTPRHRTPS